jgi:hypothetical protein
MDALIDECYGTFATTWQDRFRPAGRGKRQPDFLFGVP